MRELLRTERFRGLGSFTDDDFLQREPDVSDAAEGLLKKVGVVEGISDVSWHKDCSMGGHSRTCCSLIVGISVTGATRESGELAVVPGSHRINVAPLGVDGIDLPRLALPTQTGDITVHCSCTLHMSRPPVSAERRVVYTGFDLAPLEGDHAMTRSEAERRVERAALNDRVRDRQHRGETPSASFDL
jgi:ectoine hydroxylase-related dioxygenase (phytanoyl-CoA dioxygenase family)